jgi:hypothetical protein
MFYKNFIFYLLSNISYSKNSAPEYLKVNDFVKKYFSNYNQLINKEKFLKYKKFNKNINNILKSLGVLNISWGKDDFSPIVGDKKEFTYNLYLFKKFYPMKFLGNLVKLIKNKNFYSSKASYYFIKQHKSIFFKIIDNQFESLNYKYFNENIYQRNTKFNWLLEQSNKNHQIFDGKKRQLKNLYEKSKKDIDLEKNNLQNKIFSLIGEPIINPNFIFIFRSYKTILYNYKINKVKNYWWDFFSMNLSYNIEKNNLEQMVDPQYHPWKKTWNFSFNINTLNIYNNLLIKNYDFYKKVHLNNQNYLISSVKDDIRKENFQIRKKYLQTLKDRNNKLINIMKIFKKYYENKYKSNFFNQRYYYEFLLLLETLENRSFQIEQNFNKYCWKIFFKNPLSKAQLNSL